MDRWEVRGRGLVKVMKGGEDPGEGVTEVIGGSVELEVVDRPWLRRAARGLGGAGNGADAEVACGHPDGEGAVRVDLEVAYVRVCGKKTSCTRGAFRHTERCSVGTSVLTLLGKQEERSFRGVRATEDASGPSELACHACDRVKATKEPAMQRKGVQGDKQMEV